MALPKSVCDNCINTKCLWRAPTGGNDPPVMVCPSKIEKPQINADRIRAMTDAELAEFLSEYRCVHKAPHCREANCTQCWLDWLKSPVEEKE